MKSTAGFLPRYFLHKIRFSSSSRSLTSGPDQILPADDHRAWKAEAAVRLRIGETGAQSLASLAPISVPTLLRRTVERSPDCPALRTREEDGRHVDWTYSQYYQEVRTVAKAWIALGLEPLHSVSVVAHPHPRHHISNMAAIHAGAFTAGIYQTNSPAACEFIARDSRANIIVVGDTRQLEKILSIRPNLPDLRAVVLLDGQTDIAGVHSWEEILRLGQESSDRCLEERLSKIAINQCCVLSYTSGTTGQPKGVMLSHDNIVFTALQNLRFAELQYGQGVALSYLPQSHMAGMMLDQFICMANASLCCFADKNAITKGTLLENIQYFEPTRFMGVTRIFEKIEEGIRAREAELTGLKARVFHWAQRQALHHHKQEESGKPHSSLGYSLAQKLVFNRIHKSLGFARTAKNGFVIGGSAVSPETVRYLLSLDLKMLETTSQTEQAGFPQCINSIQPGGFRIGRVGRAYPDQCEVRLSEAGEMWSRSRAVCMGYLNNRENTVETIDDQGWLHSGDILTVDHEGFYKIVGRIKEIIITSGGENVAPTNIEDEVRLSLPDIVNIVMVCGEGRPYLSCLLTPKVELDMATLTPTENLEPRAVAWVRSVCGSEIKTVSALLESPHWAQIAAAIDEGIERANTRAVSNVAKIKRWKLLSKDFSVHGGELSPTLKLRRFHVAKLYEDVIDGMY